MISDKFVTEQTNLEPALSLMSITGQQEKFWMDLSLTSSSKPARSNLVSFVLTTLVMLAELLCFKVFMKLSLASQWAYLNYSTFTKLSYTAKVSAAKLIAWQNLLS